MRSLLLLFVFVFDQCALQAQTHKKLTVLFLGNSYTYVNNLPQLIKYLALANGDTLLYDSNCPGGQSFYGHFNDAVSISKIQAQAWDQVVLQAQSQEPSFPPLQVNSQTLPYAIKLDSVIKHHNNCSETVFYETWGRKNGDAANCASYTPLCTYIGMQNRLRASYKLFADTTHATCSPVGEAFRKSISLNPTIELYNADESHPSPEGSYLAACVFYEVLFRHSVLTNTYTAGISASNATLFQQIAHSVINDSLFTWNIGKYKPWAPFTPSLINALNYQFTSASPSLANKWFFGDGNSSTIANPTHIYNVAQTYTVSHTVTNGCLKDSSSSVLSLTSTGLINRKFDTTPIFYPNPVNKDLYMSHPIKFYTIYNVLGNVCLSGENALFINVEILQNGIYFIETEIDHIKVTQKFIKTASI